MILAHADEPLAPHDLWWAWHADPLTLGGLLVAAVVYQRGRSSNRAAEAWRPWCFGAGLVALAVALLSPVDALGGVLASAHMVQHLLLTLVAAPLLAMSAPGGTLLRGSPDAVRRAILRWRRRRGLAAGVHALRHPVPAWLLHVGALWAWHAGVLYDAALQDPVIHAAEHGTFLVTGVLFWRTVVGVRAARVPAGLGVLLLFGMSMSSALLSLLLVFARTPWYSGYATTTQVWGLEPLADQQLAGAIMWVPAGIVHVVAALALLVAWIRGTEDGGTPPPLRSTGPVPASRPGGVTAGGAPAASR
ncbi:Cytochrome c oxidase assembly factor CtaG [Blastococcus sp. DSM 46786]|uniref:cytochrome c oxidase assembly protein n=1 Tax=Blastococcus sp. DSM 46786 TaxID=1798227 RepID=UPI0008CD5FFF|nr:cytochrome c oxidase assembly protein [Blastococcus sp. DSM 46786]SEK55662.1 Cytochrome c oxidase assembly factor CtaG [Blastococcus sp. DSM 46786]